MVRTQVYLSERHVARLRRLAAATGKTQSALVRDALDRLDTPPGDRLDALRAARGIWADRDDLPDCAALRLEFDDRLARDFGEEPDA